MKILSYSFRFSVIDNSFINFLRSLLLDCVNVLSNILCPTSQLILCGKKVNEFKDGLLILFAMIKLFLVT